MYMMGRRLCLFAAVVLGFFCLIKALSSLLTELAVIILQAIIVNKAVEERMLKSVDTILEGADYWNVFLTSFCHCAEEVM